VAALFNRRNQLQWLVLLAVAVVLPTASLLWFMSRVIANERLVVGQKLAVLYQDKLADATVRTESLHRAGLAQLDKLKSSTNPYPLFKKLILEDGFEGMAIWDNQGTVVYPRTADALGNRISTDNPLADAWQLEFARSQYAEAAEAYDRFVNDRDSQVAISAIAGKTRCLARLGRTDEAISACQPALTFSVPENGDFALRLATENARLLLLSLLNQSASNSVTAHVESHSNIFHQTVQVLTTDLYNDSADRALLPANQNLFVAQKVLQAMKSPLPYADAKARDQLGRLTGAEELSIAAAETLRPFSGQLDVFFKTVLNEKPVYGLRHRTDSSTLLILLSETGLNIVLSGYHDTFTGTASTYRIVDAAGDFVAGTPNPKVKPFTVASLPEGFPGWKVELYFEGGDVFEKAAQRQIAVYTWTGFLMILLILLVAGFATRAVRRQIRLNEMKNDFIATVSHELKTPLASMRVLVETLLEGNVKDEAQVTRYLQMTAKENERLSRMIDNFLTFSRMERNKVAFTLTDTPADAIARDAIESVQTKFATHHCQLTVEITPDLPEIQADHDAIVTVLVNLLDNACKYTTEHKQVSLKVSSEGKFVCFAVADNGIGLARRHLRRIFDRFYQVDSSLARKAEGCGLGLSIVKFIIDAHKGTVAVSSKPGQGSTFTVQLPASRGNGN
jgi:signal transduction histidine kinase